MNNGFGAFGGMNASTAARQQQPNFYTKRSTMSPSRSGNTSPDLRGSPTTQSAVQAYNNAFSNYSGGAYSNYFSSSQPQLGGGVGNGSRAFPSSSNINNNVSFSSLHHNNTSTNSLLQQQQQHHHSTNNLLNQNSTASLFGGNSNIPSLNNSRANTQQQLHHHHHHQQQQQQHQQQHQQQGQQNQQQQSQQQSIPSELNTEFWREQMKLAEVSRRSGSPNHHSRAAGKQNIAVASQGASNAQVITDPLNPPMAIQNGKHKKDDGIQYGEDTGQRQQIEDAKTQNWAGLDLGGQKITNLSIALCNHYFFLTQLYIGHNSIQILPPEIGNLKSLTVLDVSSNSLTKLPAEIGRLTSLKDLRFFDNQITDIPVEIGSLYQLNFLGVDGNPLVDTIKLKIASEGSQAFIRHLRDTAAPLERAPERQWIQVEHIKDSEKTDPYKFSFMSYNILCDKYAPSTQYGYTPAWALKWSHRREQILKELQELNTDVMCLQEVDLETFDTYLTPNLALLGYSGVYHAKSRAKTMSEADRQKVDGCVTFFKTKSFNVLDKQSVDFGTIALQREDLQKCDDMFTRVNNKDHVGIIVLLEHRTTGNRLIVANAHNIWDPHYKDVKLVQTGILLDETSRMQHKWTRDPPKSKGLQLVNGEDSSPIEPPTYSSYTKLPVIVCGDYNSLPTSGVYELLSKGTVSHDHEDFMDRIYGNYTKNGISHSLALRSSYASQGELNFTNLTPGFKGTIDYIFYSTNALKVMSYLGDIDEKYVEKVVGFPNSQFPSDHIVIAAELKFRVQPGAPRSPVFNK